MLWLFNIVSVIAILSNLLSKKLWHDYQSSYYADWSILVLIVFANFLFHYECWRTPNGIRLK